MVAAFNFLAPILTLFGCAPLEKNWNFGYKGKGHCWARGTLPLSYTQGISNIITDLVYMAAPLIYISRVQLSKRTQIGIRIVFLLSIPATICSIFKTVELNNIVKTRDPTWDGVALGIWSSGEASIGILIASLPPLRKPFDYFFSKLLPSTFTGSGKTPTSSYRPTGGGASIQLQNLSNSKAYRSRIPGESVLDDESDRAILDEEHKAGGIIKSTDVEVRISSDIIDGSSDSKGTPSPPMMKHPSVDWRSHMQNGPGPRFRGSVVGTKVADGAIGVLYIDGDLYQA
ncbi:hypothetical protein HRS9139_04957 [Pyrenophora teres f. teres]|nr:hypothetical protein HRS9139_04957 [Pyrenophora teres f. teres]